MKKRTLLILLVSCFLIICTSKRNHSYANNDPINKKNSVLEESGKDSCLIAYLEKNDSLDLSWYLTFENVMSDTLSISNIFQFFRHNPTFYPGFDLYIFRNTKVITQTWHEVQLYYYITVPAIEKKRVISVLPYSKVRILMCMSNFSSIKPDSQTEIGVQIIVEYSYLNIQTKQHQQVTTVTNYLPLNKTERFEHETIE